MVPSLASGQCNNAMHRIEAAFAKTMTTQQQQHEEELPSMVGIAVAQWLAWLSTRFPFMNRRMAMFIIISIPLLPFIAAIVCVCLGQRIAGGILATLFFAVLVVMLHGANSQTRYPRTEQDLRSSLRTLQFRFGQVRAKRTKDYDLYLPQGTKDRIQCAFLLIPNEKVDHLAYASIASLLSDSGILVVVQNTEQYRLPSTLTGSGPAEIASIKQQVDKEYTITEWTIGGHGMGSIPAALLVKQLNISKLVIWGAYSSWQVDLHDSNTSVLVIIGTSDGYWTSQSEDERKHFKSLLPKENGRTVFFEMIQGGNHAGFAHYGPIPNDGERTIRVEEQQKKAAKVTALFLKNASSTYEPPSATV